MIPDTPTPQTPGCPAKSQLDSPTSYDMLCVTLSRGCAMQIVSSLVLALSAGLIVSCGGGDSDESDPASPLNASVPSVFEIQDEVISQTLPAPNPDRSAFFGDLHVHTTYSFDAYAMGTLATPYDAYRFAKGEPIPHAAGFDLQLKEPLDFYAVTDHAMFLGVAKEAADTTTEFSKNELAESLHDLNAPDNMGRMGLPGRLSNFCLLYTSPSPRDRGCSRMPSSA